MEVSDQFENVDRLLRDIKHKIYVVETIIDERIELLKGKEIDDEDQDDEDQDNEDRDDEVLETFLTHFYNDLSHFKELGYYLANRYPEPSLYELNVDIPKTTYKFFVAKYDLLHRLMHEFADEVSKVSGGLVSNHPFQEWKKQVLEKVDDFSDNADYFHEHI